MILTDDNLDLDKLFEQIKVLVEKDPESFLDCLKINILTFAKADYDFIDKNLFISHDKKPISSKKAGNIGHHLAEFSNKNSSMS